MQPAAQRQILHQVRSAALRGQSIAWMPGTLAVRPPGLRRPFVRWLPPDLARSASLYPANPSTKIRLRMVMSSACPGRSWKAQQVSIPF